MVNHSNADPVSRISRRNFLKLSATGGATLSLISTSAMLAGCSQQPARSKGYQVLRDQDIPVLAALAPVILRKGITGTGREYEAGIQKSLRAIDQLLQDSSDIVRKNTLGLLDLLSFAPTRISLVGIWSDWPNAKVHDITAFLNRWRDSSVSLFRASYGGLVQIFTMSWFLIPDHGLAIGYPGPPKKIV